MTAVWFRIILSVISLLTVTGYMKSELTYCNSLLSHANMLTDLAMCRPAELPRLKHRTSVSHENNLKQGITSDPPGS